MDSSLEHIDINDTQAIQNYMELHGVSGMGDFFKTNLDQWRDVVIKIGVTGDSGAGKSSFINAIRGLPDNHKEAAATGVVETTTKKTEYVHPTNPNIILYDLPGTGTPIYKNFESYCESVGMETFDFFLIFAATRFTQNDYLLAERVKLLEKPFFFIRTKIDQDRVNEKRKAVSFDEEAMLNNIKADCMKNLDGSGIRVEDVFLISNYYPTKWDFPRLTQAILHALPSCQRECLALSLTNLSANILEEKFKTLKGRAWMAASASAAGAVLPIPGLSMMLDVPILINTVGFYKSQLGIPDEDSVKFLEMSPRNQERVRKYCLSVSNLTQIASLFAVYVTKSLIEEVLRLIPSIGPILAANMSFSATLLFLNDCLNDLKKIALEHLDEMATKAEDDTDIE